MTKRRVYYLENNKVRDYDFDIKWKPGFSIQQKQKNVEELHDCVSKYFNVNKNSILEVSTKSKLDIGRNLSCFNLKIEFGGKSYYLESVYQSSKVFCDILGEHQVMEALNAKPSEAKALLKNEDYSTLIKFKCFGREFSLEPQHLFFDWLYVSAVNNIPDLYNQIKEFNYFTDIEFNPEKSLNSQARTLTLYLWLVRNKRLEEYLENPIKFYKNEK